MTTLGCVLERLNEFANRFVVLQENANLTNNNFTFGQSFQEDALIDEEISEEKMKRGMNRNEKGDSDLSTDLGGSDTTRSVTSVSSESDSVVGDAVRADGKAKSQLDGDTEEFSDESDYVKDGFELKDEVTDVHHRALEELQKMRLDLAEVDYIGESVRLYV